MAELMTDGEVDWTTLALAVGSLEENGREHGSSIEAREAISLIIGHNNLCAAVEHYVACRPGAELTRMVLWALHPWCAMERCYEIYQQSDDLEARQEAVELLRVVADHRALPWAQGFLEDPDEGIQAWGAGMVDQLLFTHLVDPEDCVELLGLMAAHPNRLVRERYDFITEFLQARGESAS